MGNCGSGQKLTPEELRARREAKIRSKWIDDNVRRDQEVERDAIKLLYLGAGESGKSTLLKQMTIIHGDGFNEVERKDYISLIHNNILLSAKTLVRQSARLSEFLEDKAFMVEESHLEEFNLVSELKYDDALTERVAQAVKILWSDPGIQHTFAHRSQFQLNDSTEYFMERIDAVIATGFVPTTQDILHARIRTTGIVEHTFTIGDNDFRMYDVGGQRNARRKWIHCFESVTSVIFVAAISAYDQVLYEDSNVNRMHEALNLFEDICDSRWFRRTSIILFLNKKDIFKVKIRSTPLSVCFPDYDGPSDYRSGCLFIKEEFKKRVHQKGKRIYTHFTCATDTENIEVVFNAVKTIILRSHLVEIGLMDPETDIGHSQSSPEYVDEDARLQ